ncbi:MAG TPA: hypothetical protein VMR50_04955 [Myxococcota bacterium]|nr:hypothetical protein [Myxococcota bacterium]
MRVIAAVCAFLSAGSLPGALRAAAPAGSYTIEVSDPSIFPTGKEVGLVHDPAWKACALGNHYLVCLQGNLSSDLFGVIHAEQAIAQVIAEDALQSTSSFPIEVSGKVAGTLTHPTAKLQARGEGPIDSGPLVGTGKASLHVSCRATVTIGGFGCNALKMSFCFQPAVGRRDCADTGRQGNSFRTQRSLLMITFQVTTDARNAVSGSGALDLPDTGDHVDLTVTGKYDAKRDLASFRFVSTPQPGVTLAISKFDDAAQPRSGQLGFVIGGQHGAVDLSQVFVDHTL